MIKNWNVFNNNLLNLLREQEMFIHAEKPELWKWWKFVNLKEPDFEIDNLKDKTEENRQAILYTIDILLGRITESVEIEGLTDEQMEFIFNN